MEHALGDVHEVAGVGTLFPDDGKKPVLHMHVSSGRKNKSVTGCVRRGVKVWQIMEIVLTELIGSRARRGLDPETGFHLLNP
jgi:predicted DNA-binding protein with PD1-like motif